MFEGKRYLGWYLGIQDALFGVVGEGPVWKRWENCAEIMELNWSPGFIYFVCGGMGTDVAVLALLP